MVAARGLRALGVPGPGRKAEIVRPAFMEKARTAIAESNRAAQGIASAFVLAAPAPIIVGFMVGIVPALWVLAVLVAMVLPGYLLARHLGGHRHLLPIPRRELLAPPQATMTGTVRSSGERIVAPISGVEAILAWTEITGTPDEIYFRHAVAVDFFLETPTDGTILVAGVMALAVDRLGPVVELPLHPEHLAALGLPPDVELAADALLRQWHVLAGNHLDATSTPRRELSARAGYREEEVVVLRGTPGAPVRIKHTSGS